MIKIIQFVLRHQIKTKKRGFLNFLKKKIHYLWVFMGIYVIFQSNWAGLLISFFVNHFYFVHFKFKSFLYINYFDHFHVYNLVL